MVKVVTISNSVVLQDEIYTLIAVRSGVINTQADADNLADELNSELKCEGAEIVEFDLTNLDVQDFFEGFNLFLLKQSWG